MCLNTWSPAGGVDLGVTGTFENIVVLLASLIAVTGFQTQITSMRTGCASLMIQRYASGRYGAGNTGDLFYYIHAPIRFSI